MKSHVCWAVVALSAGLSAVSVSYAEVRITSARNDGSATSEFLFENVPSPSRSDVAAQARFTVVDGRPDGNGGGVEKLSDGKVPTEEDQPAENFFFRAGTDGGRLRVDLGRAIDVKQVNTYSWHPGSRGPQVYDLYGSDGKADSFDAAPRRGVDPLACGWKLIAKVDTRSEGRPEGGQHGVSVTDSNGTLGTYQYLLLDVFRTEAADPFGNTFYSEIDVVDPSSPVVAAGPAGEPTGEIRRQVVEIEAGKYQITIDTTEAPDLTKWASDELTPVVKRWYPKIVAMLPSDGYAAPARVSITFSANMQGVAATSGTRVRCAAQWFRGQLQGEAKGAIVHELVHVVQNYGRARSSNPNATRTPGWLVEGICDYIRWFLYEPHSRGAEISARNLDRARYDGSYRITANFLHWASETHDKEIVRKLNAAAREGRYTEDLWAEYTGKPVQELDSEWKAALKEKAAAEAAHSHR